MNASTHEHVIGFKRVIGDTWKPSIKSPNGVADRVPDAAAFRYLPIIDYPVYSEVPYLELGLSLGVIHQ